MASTRYRVTFNGFQVVSETWDDVTNRDGQHDEVFFTSVNKKSKSSGVLVYGGNTSTFTSATMGDVSSPATLGRRIKAGSAYRPWYQGGGQEGGLISGDLFPPGTPWAAPLPSEIGRDYPPCMIWEDDIADDEVVHLIPTIWEWDGTTAGSVLNGWLNWQVATDAQFGAQAKRAFGPAAGAYGWIFDAVSVGIQTVGTLQGMFGPLGVQGHRPIGITRDPAIPGNGVFNPRIVELTRASAAALVNANPSGRGLGVLSIPYDDDPYLQGRYVLFLQVHKLADSASATNQLTTGQSLRTGQQLKSPNGRFTLWMQEDGHLVLYDGVPSVATAYWGTNTFGRPAALRPTHADMQADGHLVLYNDSMIAAWGSGVYGPNYTSPYLELQDNGNLVIYHNGREPVWASNTLR